MERIFPVVVCGVADGTGCGSEFYGIDTEYLGLSFRGGFMVTVWKIKKPFDCAHCGRKSTHVYEACKDSDANRAIEIDREIADALNKQRI